MSKRNTAGGAGKVATASPFRRLLDAKNLRPEDLASLAPCSVATVYNAIRGKQISMGTASLFAVVLDRKATDILRLVARSNRGNK